MKSASAIGWLIISVLLLGVRTADAGETGVCPEVASVRLIPLKKGSGSDPVYERLIQDDNCEAKLIQALDDLTKMRDPRQAPIETRFVVSDAAVFILLNRRRVEIETILPDKVAAQWESRGIYAYFDYVATPAGRRDVIARVKEIIAGKTASNSPKLLAFPLWTRSRAA